MATIDLRAFEKLLDPDRYRQNLESRLLSLRDDGEVEARRNANQRLNRRSGALLRSIESRLDLAPQSLELALVAGGPDAPYVQLQDEGGEVEGKPWLRVPLPRALAGGVDRYPGSLREQAPDRFAVAQRAGGGPLLLVDMTTGEPWYVLKRRVRIPATHFLRDAFEGVNRRLPGVLDQVALDTLEAL